MLEYTQEDINREAFYHNYGDERPNSRANGHDKAPPVAFDTICAADLEGETIPDREWLVEGVIPHCNVTLLGGDGGLGKSVLGLMLGASLAAKAPWLGFPAMQGPFLYLGAEDDAHEIHRRLDRIQSEMGCGWSELCDFHFKSLAGEDALLATFEKGVIQPTPLFTRLEAKLKDMGAVAVAIDTAADVFGGDEISRTQVRQFIGLLRRLCLTCGVSVVLLSHPSVAGMASGTGTSGSTAWNNSVRSRLYLEAADDDTRTLRFMKSNYGPKGEPLTLTWQNGLFVPERIIIKTPAEADAMFLVMVDAYASQGRPVSAVKSANYAPKVFSDDPMCKGFGRQVLGQAMNRLFTRKEIKVETFGPPSKPRTRLIRMPSN